jgi:hypothetical protein
MEGTSGRRVNRVKPGDLTKLATRIQLDAVEGKKPEALQFFAEEGVC